MVEVGTLGVKEAFSSLPGVKGGLGRRNGPEPFSAGVSRQYRSGVREVTLISDSEGYGSKSSTEILNYNKSRRMAALADNDRWHSQGQSSH